MRQAIANSLLMGLAAAFLFHFIRIAIYKQVLIQEPNPLILIVEFLGLIAIIGFAIGDLIKGR